MSQPPASTTSDTHAGTPASTATRPVRALITRAGPRASQSPGSTRRGASRRSYWKRFTRLTCQTSWRSGSPPTLPCSGCAARRCRQGNGITELRRHQRRTLLVSDPYDDIPIEVRRDRHGWFGVPWWSYVCYDEAGELIEDMRKAFPVDESCLYCGEQFDEAAGDSGTATVAVTMNEGAPVGQIAHVHKECQFRQVTGGLAHHEGRCHCHGGEGNR